MAIKSMIQDGEGTHRTAGVTLDHELKVTNRPLSLQDIYNSGELSLYTRRKIYVDELKDPGDNSGLNADGSVTPIIYSIASETDKLKSIYYVRIIIHDTQTALGSAEGRRFCSAYASPGAPNGLEFYIEQSGVQTNIFVDPVQQIASFLDYTDDYINEPGGLGAGVDLLTIQINFVEPINIVPGGIDAISMKVQDDFSGIQRFIVVASGVQELLEL